MFSCVTECVLCLPAGEDLPVQRCLAAGIPGKGRAAYQPWILWQILWREHKSPFLHPPLSPSSCLGQDIFQTEMFSLDLSLSIKTHMVKFLKNLKYPTKECGKPLWIPAQWSSPSEQPSFNAPLCLSWTDPASWKLVQGDLGVLQGPSRAGGRPSLSAGNLLSSCNPVTLLEKGEQPCRGVVGLGLPHESCHCLWDGLCGSMDLERLQEAEAVNCCRWEGCGVGCSQRTHGTKCCPQMKPTLNCLSWAPNSAGAPSKWSVLCSLSRQKIGKCQLCFLMKIHCLPAFLKAIANAWPQPASMGVLKYSTWQREVVK